MASEIAADGRVFAPLNITAPAPALNLRGFKWDTVDEKIHGPLLREEAAPTNLTSQAPASATPAAPNQQPAPEQKLKPLSQQLTKQLQKDENPFDLKFPLEQFQGTYAGNGFNLIFRPRSKVSDDVFPESLPPSKRPQGPGDNILELNLTTEQLTFGENLGKIPNRGFVTQKDLMLAGVPYLQTVQDKTNTETGKGDHAKATGIHFEPGVWLHVPEADFHTKKTPSVVRMASIPHGTTINAQGLIPTRVLTNTVLGGVAGPPIIDTSDTTITRPFTVEKPTRKFGAETFPSLDASNPNTFRIPQNLEKFIKNETITQDIINNPNQVLKNVIENQKIIETITFEVSTGLPTADLNGGGTANISFLAGKQPPGEKGDPKKDDLANAHAAFMKAKYWIERVEYQVNVPKMAPFDTVLLFPDMSKSPTAPTPVFSVTAPAGGVPLPKTITVPGNQIQSSQTVFLNFGPPKLFLSWPHISVATMVPTSPQSFQMT